MFESIKSRFIRNWVTISQLRRYVQLQAITEEQYKEICGKDYTETL